MPKYFDPSILAHLRQKENLQLALEIGRYVPRLKEELFGEFWSKLVEELEKTRPQTLPADCFQFAIPSKSEMLHNGTGINSTPPASEQQQTFLCFRIEQERDEEQHNLYIGVFWSKQVQKNSELYQHQEVHLLKSRMLEEGYEFWPPYWLCGRYVAMYQDPDQFLVEFAENPAQVISTVVEPFWQMALSLQSSVSGLNNTLKSV